MNHKNRVLLVLLGISLVSFEMPESKTNRNNMLVQIKNKADGALRYQKDFDKFSYFIETIGTVSIDEVKFINNKLTAIYSYNQGSEVRNVVSALNQDNDGIYKGTCTTKVNGKVLFKVNTWLTFSENGTATGNWSWSSNPTKNDPIVTISKIK